MARKRKLDATIPSEETTPDTVEKPATRPGQMGGMWAGSAMNMLKQRIDDAHSSLVEGIKAGTVALQIDPGQIDDDLGSDRVGDWQGDKDFAALVANIKRRGQTQPIRVRPASADWTPNTAEPLRAGGRFVIQSGRRRLEACRKLGRPVMAVISTTEGDLALADLEERFHENTMRRNLNGFEELLSIGLLADSMKDLTQAEIAERLSVGQGDVSLGLACLEHREAILDRVDVTTTAKRTYRSIVPKIKRGEPLGPLLPPAVTGHQPQPFDVRGIPMVAKKTDSGFGVNIKQARVDEASLEPMLLEIAKVIMKYQAKKK